MKIKLFLGLLLVMLFTSDLAQAQRYRNGYRRGYHHGYYSRGPRAVVVVNPGPYTYRSGYYGPQYRRGFHPGYRRGYYAHHGYYGPRRHYYRRGW